MSARPAAALAARLAAQAETVCRHYLPSGRRAGAYWIVGDVRGSPGRSLYVRLFGARAGRWRDGATGEHGDLLDLIAANRSLDLREALDEARRFLALPAPVQPREARAEPLRSGSSCEGARRLFSFARLIAGTPAEVYLTGRGIALARDDAALRFHPCCLYREESQEQTWPALLAAVRDIDGRITGVQRTYFTPDGSTKAPVATPRRALGRLMGHGVQFPAGPAVKDVLVAGEGLETVLSLKTVLPGLPMVAALSAAHLGGLLLPPGLARLYVACDRDTAGERAFARLRERAGPAGIEVRPLMPEAEDFNADLIAQGPERLRRHVVRQLAGVDAARFAGPPERG